MNTDTSDFVPVHVDGDTANRVVLWVEVMYRGLEMFAFSGTRTSGSNGLKKASTKEMGCQLRTEQMHLYP
jgi:hypothetical protein